MAASSSSKECGDPWFEAEWARLRSSFGEIVPATSSSSSSVSREELYRSVEDLCVEGFASDLYDRVAKTLYASAEEKTKALDVTAGETLLAEVAWAWRRHRRETEAVAAICLYLDRSYALKRAVGLREAGDLAFRRALLGEAGLEAALVAKARDVARGKGPPGNTEEAAAKECCDMLSQLDLYAEILEPLILRDARDAYAAEGRRLSFQVSAATTTDLASEAAAYSSLVSSTLAEADARVDGVLPERTRPFLRAAVEDHLVAPHAARAFARCFEALVDAKRDDVLGDLYAFLRRVAATDVAKKAVKDLAVARAAATLNEGKPGGAVGDLLHLYKRLASLCSARFRDRRGDDDDDDDGAAEYTETETSSEKKKKKKKKTTKKKETTAADGAAPEKKSWGSAVLKDAFEEALNADAAASKFAETLAAYFAQAVADAKSLDGGMLLFRFSRSKDVFEAFFRRDLADRLLAARSAERGSSSSRSPSSSSLAGLGLGLGLGGTGPSSTKKTQEGCLSLENERAAIALLEKECGASYVSKLEGMCNDLDLAKTLAADYAREQQYHKVEVVPLVLTTGYWPSYPATGLRPAPGLEDARRRFMSYYADKFQGRRLHWHDHLGRCVVRGTFAKKSPSQQQQQQQQHAKKTTTTTTYQFDCSPAQAAVLCAVSTGSTTTTTKIQKAELAEATGLDAETLAPVLASLGPADQWPGLLFSSSENSVVAVNRAFQSKTILVKVPAPTAGALGSSGHLGPDDRAKVVDAVSRDRLHAIDAALVRVMKARKTLPHHQLLADVLAKLKHPATAADIKLRIESLIEREYLERDDAGANYYNYLA